MMFNSSEATGTGLEGSIYASLESLTAKLLDREWLRDDGAAMRIGRCLIDANWGQSTDVVYQFCRQSRHAAVIIPSHGRFVGDSSLPFSEYRRRPGDRVGLNWRIPNVHGKRAIRHVVYDTNWWKSFINARLRVSMGNRGCLSLFGTNAESQRLFAEHLTSEYFTRPRPAVGTLMNGSSDWSSRTTTGSTAWLVQLLRHPCKVACSPEQTPKQR